MFVLPGLIGLVIFIYARPFEFIPELMNVPFLYIFFAAAVLGFVIDVRLARTKLYRAPQLAWVVIFVVWAVGTLFASGAGLKVGVLITVVVDLALFFLIAHGVRSFKGIEALTAVVLVCSLWISVVCVHQGLQDRQCIWLSPTEPANARGTPDGRPCDTIEQCYLDASEPEALYRCEHAGWFGTSSISGRVRYVGVLQDPNETALVVAIGFPLALGFYNRKKNKRRLAVVGIVALLAAVTVIFSMSRGGVLVLGAVLATYFVRRFGVRGAITAGVLVIPVLLLGGRGGDEASTSSEERLLAWYEGIRMFRFNPGTGVGLGQFTEHHSLTAHNSFILAPAELGVLGMIAWTSVLYVSAKIPWHALRTLKDDPAEPARVWAMTLMSSFAGLLVGAFFLSFTYHFVLWIYVGLAGAYYAAVRRHDPEWHVPLGLRDLGLVVFANVFVLGSLYVYTIIKLGGA